LAKRHSVVRRTIARSTAELAKDHQTGGDAGTSRQRNTPPGFEPLYPRDEIQPGAYRSFRVIFVSVRIREVNGCAVVGESRHRAIPSGGHLVAAGMARSNYVAQFLRIEPRRKIPQSNEVARDDRQVAPFGLDPWGDSRTGDRRRGGRAPRLRSLLLFHFPHLADKADSLAR
jgi:hypothetical protein